MHIRTATHADLDGVYSIYARARRFMRENGNPDQWGDVYPPKELIISDLEEGRLHVLVDENGALAAVFSLFLDGDPDYDEINGAWLNELSYIAVHRVASAGTHKGVFAQILDFCLGFSSNIKIDTHFDNHIMQSILKKHGFIPCGTIRVEGMDFLAFQLIID
jgi:hypothetical protein